MLINGSLVADEDYISGLINACLLSQGRFFFPLSVEQIRFCLCVMPGHPFKLQPCGRARKGHILTILSLSD